MANPYLTLLATHGPAAMAADLLLHGTADRDNVLVDAVLDRDPTIVADPAVDTALANHRSALAAQTRMRNPDMDEATLLTYATDPRVGVRTAAVDHPNATAAVHATAVDAVLARTPSPNQWMDLATHPLCSPADFDRLTRPIVDKAKADGRFATREHGRTICGNRYRLAHLIPRTDHGTRRSPLADVSTRRWGLAHDPAATVEDHLERIAATLDHFLTGPATTANPTQWRTLRDFAAAVVAQHPQVTETVADMILTASAAPRMGPLANAAPATVPQLLAVGTTHATQAAAATTTTPTDVATYLDAGGPLDLLVQTVCNGIRTHIDMRSDAIGRFLDMLVAVADHSGDAARTAAAIVPLYPMSLRHAADQLQDRAAAAAEPQATTLRTLLGAFRAQGWSPMPGFGAATADLVGLEDPATAAATIITAVGDDLDTILALQDLAQSGKVNSAGDTLTTFLALR